MKRNRVAFLKPEEPAFLRKIKEKLRYQEGPDVDTKRQELSKSDQSDLSDRKDEMPQVDLEDSNITEEEAKAFMESQSNEQRDQRVIFKKPAKKDSHKGLVFTSSEKKTEADTTTNLDKKRKSDKEDTKSAKVHLLSFNEDDDE